MNAHVGAIIPAYNIARIANIILILLYTNTQNLR